MKPFLQLVALLTALTSGLTFVIGVLNKLFDWNLGLGIGGFDIDLPQDFVGTTAVAVGLLAMAGLFELMANFRQILSKVKARPLPYLAVLVLVVGSAVAGLYNLAGGALGVAVENNDVERVSALIAESDYSKEALGAHLYQALRKQQLELSLIHISEPTDRTRSRMPSSA